MTAVDLGRLHVNVTERSGDEIVQVSRRAAEQGLTGVQLVDDHVSARPGTVPNALLGPLEASTLLSEARAARILGESG